MNIWKIIANLYNRGKYILKRDGPINVLKKGLMYFSSVLWLYLQRSSIIDKILYKISLNKLRKYQSEEKGLDDIINTAYNFKGVGIYKSIMPIQFKEEISMFAKICNQHSPKIIVEIGTAYGGTLYILSRYLYSAQKIICIDLDDRFFSLGYFKQRSKLLKEFAPDKEIYCLFGNSHDNVIEAELSKILNGKKIDVLFIDGNHSYNGVKDDFERYKKYMAESGIIALHDIVYSKYNINPPRYWKEIKNQGYRTEEIIFLGAKILSGIGVVYMNNVQNAKRHSD